MDREKIEREDKNSNLFAMLSTIVVLMLAFLLASSPIFISQGTLLISSLSEEASSYFAQSTINDTKEEDEILSPVPFPITDAEDDAGFKLAIIDPPTIIQENNLSPAMQNDKIVNEKPNPVVPPLQPVNTEGKSSSVVAVTPRVSTNTKTTVKVAPAIDSVAADAFWVQIASFSTIERARDNRHKMMDRGLSTHIDTVTMTDGRVIYRLRAGAWSNRQEAERFVTLVRNINGFEGAFIIQSIGKRK